MLTNLNEEHSILGKGRKVPSVRKVDTRYLAGGERSPPPGGQPRGSAADALGVLLGKANCRGRVALAAPARGGLALGLALLGAGRILNDAEMWSKNLTVETRRLKAKHATGYREM